MLQAPRGMIHVVLDLAKEVPSLGAPLTAASAVSLAPIFRHPLLQKWCQQSAWQTTYWDNFATTWDSVVTERFRCLRALNMAPNAGAWLTALPTSTNEPAPMTRGFLLLSSNCSSVSELVRISMTLEEPVKLAKPRWTPGEITPCAAPRPDFTDVTIASATSSSPSPKRRGGTRH